MSRDPAGPRASPVATKVVKFAGCYHGHVDALLAAAGSGRRDLRPARHRRASRSRHRATRSCCPTTTAPPSRRPSPSTATGSPAVITEAAPGNMGVVPPVPGFNAVLAETCRRARRAARSVDEVMTGFRASRQGQWGSTERRGRRRRPVDLRQGDGRRLARRGLRRPRRRHGAARPAGPVYQAGTLSGNPVATAAGPGHAATGHRRRLRPHAPPPARRSRPLVTEALTAAGVPHVVQAPATCSRCSSPDPQTARRASRLRRRRRRRTPPRSPRSSTPCWTRGVYLPPSAFEAWFVSAAHDDACRPDASLDALPAARAGPLPSGDRMTDKTIVHLLRHGEVHNPEGVLYGRRAGYHLSELGQADGRRVADAVADRDITHLRRLPAGAGPGDRRSRSPTRRGLEIVTDERLIESSQRLRGQAVRRRRRRAAQARATGGTCANPFRPSWGEPYTRDRGPDDGRARGRPRRRPRPRGGLRLPPAADLDHPAARREAVVPARPAQAAVHAVLAHLASLRGRHAGPGVATPSPPAT